MTAAVPGIELFCGICTYRMTGGLNVNAVDAALALGPKIVWLPTVHAEHEVLGKNVTGFTGNLIDPA